jgi:hypothetical protein
MTRVELGLAKLPQVRAVYNDLKSTDFIEEGASDAGGVYHFASCDHVDSAKAIAAGLAGRKFDRPGYWIHTSTGMVIALESIQKRAFGKYRAKEFNDWEGVDEVISLSDLAPHRQVDKIVLEAVSDHVRIAIVCPLRVCGSSRVVVNLRSM